MTDTIHLHKVDKVKISKTTQNTREGVERIDIKAGEHEITICGSKDEESGKEKTIELEVEE